MPFLFFDIQIQLFKLMYSVRKLDLILTYWLKLRVIIFLARCYVNVARNDMENAILNYYIKEIIFELD